MTDDQRDAIVIPRLVIAVIALASASAMIVNALRGGAPANTLILAGVVCSTWGVDGFIRWRSR